MSNQIDPDEARSWLDAIPGGQLGLEAERQWQEFAANDQAVVTVYGAYDTGKSSLLRRLIVDAGLHVPEWLTISARHETFEVNEFRAAGCILRDTPGFVTGGVHVRADMNTQLANEAVDLTDVAIVTVTPQLATAEYPALQALVRRDWAQGSLWFVISRFDEAGVDPESDEDGYRQLAQRKTDELRRALDLDNAVPVFVVSQDFTQMAGAERNPDPQLWDEFREWDGMGTLSQALIDLGADDDSALRDAAAQRFWRRSIIAALSGIRSEADNYVDHADFSDEGLQLRESWLSQLDVLQRSAEADLRSRISETVGAAVDDQRDAGAFQKSLEAAIDFWYTVHERDIEKLLHNVDETTAIERQRPSWQELEDLVDAIRGEADATTSAEESPEVITPAVQRVSKAALAALTEYEKLTTLKKPSSSTAASAMGVSRRVAVATAVVPLVVEMSSIAEQLYKSKVSAEERDRQRRTLAAELDRVGGRAATMALAEFEPLVASAHRAILDATAEQVDMRNGLRKLVAELHAQIASGEALLAT